MPIIESGDISMPGGHTDAGRRSLIGLLGAASLGPNLAHAQPARPEAGDEIDVRRDFHAAGDGSADDTVALQAAIEAGSRSLRPIKLSSGVYRIVRPLLIPSNTMLRGSAWAMGFGCRLEPSGCPAFIIGGSKPSFHCSLENMLIWPRGSAPEFVVSIDNSYSISLRNLRIHNSQAGIGRSAVLLLGDQSAGGHGTCNDILWDNLIVRNDVEQGARAVLATPGCGSHRFLKPCLENYSTLFEWQGGQIDLLFPYTERAGRYALDCNSDPRDASAYLNTFGGLITSAESGVACAIRENTGAFNSYGTAWGGSATLALYVYGIPSRTISLHGVFPNLSGKGAARFAGIAGWRRCLHFPGHILKATVSADITVAPQGLSLVAAPLTGLTRGDYWVRVSVHGDPKGLIVSGHVHDADTVQVSLRNLSDQPVTLTGGLTVECGLL